MTYKSNIQVLLEDIPQSYYWVGFIMADGNISNKCTRLQISLSNKDKSHLESFKKYIESEAPLTPHKKHNTHKISIMNTKIIRRLSEKFDISHRKTYEPPNIECIIKDKDLFYSFIIGFIDGDGCVAKQTKRNDSCIIIKMHISWSNILQYISDRIGNDLNLTPNEVHINKYGYAEIRFSNSIILKYLKQQAIRLYLPVLKRKWDKIDMNIVSRQERSKTNIYIVKNLLKEGKRNKDICKILGLKPPAISNIIKRNNLKELIKNE